MFEMLFEILAVGTAVVGSLLVISQTPRTRLLGFSSFVLSSLVALYVMYQAGLFLYVGLQVIYLGTSIAGVRSNLKAHKALSS